MLRIAIRCERRLFRDSLVRCLGACSDIHVVGHVAAADDLMALCALSLPDVVLFDAGERLPDGLHTLAAVRSRFPHTGLVVSYDRLAPRELRIALRSGVDSLVPCSHGLEALLAVLRHCRTGRVTQQGLTELDREILTLISAGHQADEIAALVGISKSAVENRKRRLYHKLNVNGQSQAVARAADLGLIKRSSGAAGGGLPELTVREGDILRSIARGHTVRQTARLLGVAVKTVENTQARLFRKLGVRNRAAAFAMAQSLGLV